MKNIVFATNNKNKLQEIRAIAGGEYNILSLSEIGCHDDIPETAATIEGNAMLKARWVKDKYGYDCFADDTGLEVTALDGRPGVYSARYAGEDCDSERNIDKLLGDLQRWISAGNKWDKCFSFCKCFCNSLIHGYPPLCNVRLLHSPCLRVRIM